MMYVPEIPRGGDVGEGLACHMHRYLTPLLRVLDRLSIRCGGVVRCDSTHGRCRLQSYSCIRFCGASSVLKGGFP
jgi:hypothetical protein